MILLGDIASPKKSYSSTVQKIFNANREIFFGKKIICNFEGLVYDGVEIKLNEPVLYNHSSILKVLNPDQRSILCLANNHILDLPGQFSSSIQILRNEGFLYCGAGFSRTEAENLLEFKENNISFAIFNACWDFLLYNHRNPRHGIYVATLQEQKLVDRIKKYREANPYTRIMVYLHWSLDLETLPFPMYRQFSKAIIDAGCNLVIGAHAHCVQGGEKYGNGYILYGLGNFFIPDHYYAGGNLHFPDFAKLELALEWDFTRDKIMCHWFKSDKINNLDSIIYLKSEDFENSQQLKELSPFAGMTDEEYIKYFKKYRRKKILIPVYTDFRKRFRNRFYTIVLKSRARTARFLARIKLISWQN